MPNGIRVHVSTQAKGKIIGRVQAGARVEFEKTATSRVRELLVSIGEGWVLVNMVDHPNKDDKRMPRWQVKDASDVIGLADSSEISTATTPPTTNDPTPTPRPDGNNSMTSAFNALLKPFGDALKPLRELIVEISDRDEELVAQFVLAQGLNPLISRQTALAEAAKDEAIEEIRKARGEVFIAMLVEVLTERGMNMVEQARQTGLADIIPVPATDLSGTDTDTYDPADAERWRVPERPDRTPKLAIANDDAEKEGVHHLPVSVEEEPTGTNGT